MLFSSTCTSLLYKFCLKLLKKVSRIVCLQTIHYRQSVVIGTSWNLLPQFAVQFAHSRGTSSFPGPHDHCSPTCMADYGTIYSLKDVFQGKEGKKSPKRGRNGEESRKLRIKMVEQMGVEPTTYTMRTCMNILVINVL